MLVPDQQFTVAELPHLLIYPDHASASRFYAVPATPRIAVDDRHSPQISLLIYGRKHGSTIQPMGAQISLTTSLGLTAQERDLLMPLLTARLTAQPQSDVQPPELVSPDWLTGDVTVHLADRIELVGKPALIGNNECALSLSLTADQTASLQDALANGLPDATITYQVQVSAAKLSSSSTETSQTETTQQDSCASQRSHRLNVQIERTEAIRYNMTLAGPLVISKPELDNCSQIISL